MNECRTWSLMPALAEITLPPNYSTPSPVRLETWYLYTPFISKTLQDKYVHIFDMHSDSISTIIFEKCFFVACAQDVRLSNPGFLGFWYMCIQQFASNRRTGRNRLTPADYLRLASQDVHNTIWNHDYGIEIVLIRVNAFMANTAVKFVLSGRELPRQYEFWCLKFPR